MLTPSGRQGVKQGTHVSVMLPNCSEFPLTWLALAKLGAVIVPINNRYHVRDLEYTLTDSDSTAFIIHSEYIPVYRQVSLSNQRVEKVFCVGPGNEDLGPSLPELTKNMPEEFKSANPTLDSVINLQYSSGTTGFPKAAITTHEYWLLLGSFGTVDAGGRCFFDDEPILLHGSAMGAIDGLVLGLRDRNGK